MSHDKFFTRPFLAACAARMPIAMRICRFFAALIAAAALSGQSAITDPLALWL
jgi:hypothetical protein